MHVSHASASMIAVLLWASAPATGLAQAAPSGQLDPLGSQAPTSWPSDCVIEIEAQAQRGSLPDGVVERNLKGLTPDPEILAALGSQAEFEQPIWGYIDRAV